jgi:hypothetical protein
MTQPVDESAARGRHRCRRGERRAASRSPWTVLRMANGIGH